MSKSYSIYEARAKFSELVRTVLSTGSVLITQRGVPVIRLVPYSPGEDSIEQRIIQLEHTGKARKARSRWPKQYEAVTKSTTRRGAVKRFLDERD